MRLIRTTSELRDALRSQRLGNRAVGFVPTMGALHEGHLSLLRVARERADKVVVSIFVNPLQFGQGEDFQTYPRNVESDLQLLQSQNVDVAFVPTVEEMYPRRPSTTVSAGPLGRILEGADRPGHFDGVCTVVAKLFNLVQPTVAVFGQKDAQQVAVLRRMVHDLGFPVDLVVAPTVRDDDFLALSSRNLLLSATDRERALTLWRALNAGRTELSSGSDLEVIEKTMWDVLTTTSGVEPSYARVVDPDSFETPVGTGPVLLVVAARVGRVRLIDNLPVAREAEGET